jgi:hypothetical protein
MITVKKLRDDEARLVFDVTVEGKTRHEVTLSRADHERLARDEDPAAFIERCFAFLLEREPKESILSRFDVSVISRYFPEFERVIRR